MADAFQGKSVNTEKGCVNGNHGASQNALGGRLIPAAKMIISLARRICP